jgi:hypothetical protein
MRSIVRGIVVWVAGHGMDGTEMEAGLCSTGHAADGAGSYPHVKAELNMRIILT